MTQAKTNLKGKISLAKTSHPEAQWYVIHTYSGREGKVALTLEERVRATNMQDSINEILVPTQEKIVIDGGKKKSVPERLFPGYILVKMVLDDKTWHLVRSTGGVTGFVGAGNKPTPLPEKEVKTILKFMKMEAPKFEAKFNVGDAVRIIKGPFTDFIGKVDEVDEDKGKVKVLVSVFGRETPVELDFMQVSPL